MADEPGRGKRLGRQADVFRSILILATFLSFLGSFVKAEAVICLTICVATFAILTTLDSYHGNDGSKGPRDP